MQKIQLQYHVTTYTVTMHFGVCQFKKLEGMKACIGPSG